MPAPPPPPPKKPIIKREGFVIKDGFVTFRGFPCYEGSQLELMFHPEQGKSKLVRYRSARDARQLFSRTFFAAQLRWYGIAFPKTATEPELKSLLEKAVAAQRCKCIPPPVAKTQQELRIDYERELAVWQEAVDNWEDNWKRRQDEEWAKLETPGERAAHDLDRFLEHYFSTDGQPDPDKNPEPLALDGITDAQLVADIHTKAATVPGLEIITCGQEADRTICIGWDRAAVCDLASEVQTAARERHRNQMQVEWEAEWEAAMQTHREFVERQHGSQAAPPTFGVPHGTRLGAACGCFVLYCKAMKDMFPNHPRSSRLSMNISHGPGNNDETLRAAVDFGVFHGAAILSCLRPIMDWFVNYYDKTALEAVGRAQSSSSASGLGKRKAEGQVDGERPPQKRKAHELAPHGRVFLRMRGRGGIGDEIFPDIQRGYLDFADSACTKFKGVFDIPGVGEDVEVEGFRVGAHAVVDPPPWTWFWPGVQHPASSKQQ